MDAHERKLVNSAHGLLGEAIAEKDWDKVADAFAELDNLDDWEPSKGGVDVPAPKS